MTAELQVKLLRVLESGRLTPVGGRQDMSVNVRLLAATNRDPRQAVSDGSLREDLFFRLNVFPICVPPLRARTEDIPLLVKHFLSQMATPEKVSGFSPDAIAAMQRHAWRGNVRELRNVIEHAVIMAPADGVVDCDHLPPELRGESDGGASSVFAAVGTPLETLIREHTLATLEHFDGNKTKTAEVLGISLKTLYNRLERYREHDVDDR